MKIVSKGVILLMILTSCFNHNVASQTGNEIYYSSESNSRGRDIYKMNSDGSNKIKLTKKTGNGHYPHNINLKISLDGSKIVYQSDPDRHDRYTIWTMNTDGSNQKKITEEEGLYPNWSPDGKQIIFSERRNGVWEILIVSSEGGKETMVTSNRSEGISPGWGAPCSFHPNGEFFVYTSVREKVMYSMNLSTKEKIRISPIGERYVHPMYSKNGSRIAVIRKKTSAYDLITISPNGKGEKVIAKNVISYSNPAWSNSGKEILFTGMVSQVQQILKKNIETGIEVQLTSNSDFDAMPTWN